HTRNTLISDSCNAIGAYFLGMLAGLAEDHASIVQVRGRGLLIGVEFDRPVAPLISALLDTGIICGPAGPNVLRFLPPLVVGKEEVDCVMAAIEACLEELGW
ncbi:MAG TPA: aminotransferase class III-fold pyridoxal phosphate-dependent enzyme, partial [Candidatus Hydrogenedentes bacterium]|nr:aminotransferase class III-fold pyridoxal phosphate-dependent enzyme [Candidatus Hydrogenedentota bacterium]